MKKQAWSGLIAATVCTLAIGVSAQTSSQTSPTTGQSSTSAADRITVTGCVARESSSATAGATGTSGTTASSSSSMSNYVLNVSPSSSSAAGTTTSGTTAGSATAGTSGAHASSYKLEADDSKLSAHVGHKVEITGTLDKSTSSTAPSGSTSSAGTSASSSSMSPKLKVDSVRMIASSCSN